VCLSTGNAGLTARLQTGVHCQLGVLAAHSLCEQEVRGSLPRCLWTICTLPGDQPQPVMFLQHWIHGRSVHSLLPGGKKTTTDPREPMSAIALRTQFRVQGAEWQRSLLVCRYLHWNATQLPTRVLNQSGMSTDQGLHPTEVLGSVCECLWIQCPL